METKKWTLEKANSWYKKLPWRVGCNFIPSTAINQLEMFQKDTFDPKTINKELEWAQNIGFNTLRVYLHDLLYEADEAGFKKTIEQFLKIAEKNGHKICFTLFDDCWNPKPKIGKQKPISGIHNCGWLQSPGVDVVNNPKEWGRLEKYIKGITKTFGQDERVLIWDVYNEPGNSTLQEKSLPLLQKAFEWAKESDPIQPVTSGVWNTNRAITTCQIIESDVITFHNYSPLSSLLRQIDELKTFGRPLICTEYMARGAGSIFQTHLPFFKSEKVGCLNWGLVDGKTRTKYPWGTTEKEGESEPRIWFHEIFHTDGKPYNKEETDFIRKITKDKKLF